MPTIRYITHQVPRQERLHTAAQVQAVCDALEDHLPAMQHIVAKDGYDPSWLELPLYTDLTTPPTFTVAEDAKCLLRVTDATPAFPFVSVEVYPLQGAMRTRPGPDYVVVLNVSDDASDTANSANSANSAE